MERAREASWKLCGNIADRNMIANVWNLYQRSNLLISDFRVCDSIALDSLHKIYCMHMYGSELWNLNCSYVDDFKGTDQAGTFMSLKCVVYYANYRTWHQSSKIQVVS